MATFIRVTMYASGKPLLVNADQVVQIAPNMRGSTNLVCAREGMIIDVNESLDELERQINRAQARATTPKSDVI